MISSMSGSLPLSNEAIEYQQRRGGDTIPLLLCNPKHKDGKSNSQPTLCKMKAKSGGEKFRQKRGKQMAEPPVSLVQRSMYRQNARQCTMETYVGSTGNAFHVLPSIPTLYSSGIAAGASENVSLRGDADRHRGEFPLLSRVFKQRRSATGAPTTQRILCAERTPVAAKRLHPSVTAIGVSENARQSARAAT